MKTIALNRLGLLGMSQGKGWTAQQKVVFLAELAKMGYRITNPELLDEASEAFLMNYRHLMQVLKHKKGGNVAYVPLFSGFPNDVPDDETYFIKRVFAYLGNTWGSFEKEHTMDTGTKVPAWLFDLKSFGADPVTQMQSAELYQAAFAENANKGRDTHVEWTDLTIVFDDTLVAALKAYLKSMVYARASIKEALHADLIRLMDYLGTDELDGRQIVFKETKAFVLQHLWKQEQYASVKVLIGNAVDVLRLFAALTDSDVSLSDPIKFPKLSRKQRKVVLDILEQCSDLSESLKQYKGLWLEIGRYIHPMEYKAKFPATAAAFDALRNGKIDTFASVTERLLLLQEVAEVLRHLRQKPGVFARKVHEILRRFPEETDQVMEAFAHVVNKLELKNMLVLRDYFNTINEAENRTIVNKKGKIKVLPNNAYGALTAQQVGEVLKVLDEGINAKIASKASWKAKKVWIDPELAHYTVPLQQRKASDGIVTVGRGSKIKVDFDKVLRLFVYWKDAGIRTDLDLSVAQYDANWQYVGHVSYTNLATNGIVHSGDIQSAPHGAAEFIDISLSALSEHVRYLAPQVYKYAGSNFADIDCHAGWMVRDQVSAELKTFDIKTVANKFDLNGVGSYALPLVVDVRNGEMLMTDLYVSGRAFYNNVEGARGDVSVLCREMMHFVQTRPNMLTLAYLHAENRCAEMVHAAEDADITFGIKDCTYNATDVEKVLAELI